MISSKVKFVTEFFLALALLAAASFFVYIVYPKISDYNSLTSFYGLDRLSEKEAFLELGELEMDGKAFWEINPLELSRLIALQNPLVQDVKFRRYIFPTKQVKVYITEKEPWASYNHKIVENSGEIMADMEWKIAKNLNPVTRKNLQTIKEDLVKIYSYSLLKSNDLISIRYLVKLIEEAVSDKIIKINSDREHNLTMYTDSYKIKIGPMNKNTIEKVKRINLIAAQIHKLTEESEENPLDYIDLSLSTQEVILGQKKSLG